MAAEHDQDSLQAPKPRHAKGTVAAWCVILLMTVFMMVAMQSSQSQSAPRSGDGKLGQALFKFQAQYMVGAAAVLGDQADDALRQQLQDSEAAPHWQQLRVGIVAGELSGPEAALKKLRGIKASSEEARTQAAETAVLEVLIRLYRDYSKEDRVAPSVRETDRKQLQSELGWFGKLALAPPGTEGPLRDQALSAARKTFYAVVMGFAGVAVVGLLGLFVLIVFVAILFGQGLPEFSRSEGRGGVHAEAFACWLVLFLSLNMVGGAWFGSEAVAAVSLFSLAGSFLAFAWPLLRGVSWPQLRQDLGWTMGRGLPRELAAGLGCYAMAIPLLMLGVLVTSILAGLWSDGVESGGAPVHPVARWLMEGSWWQRAQLAILACVVAPILEETMFRGFFYRHMREVTAAMSRGASVLVSALITSVFFAVLHPQGLLAAPAITAIGLAFAFMREWRESLLPSIIAHALHNTVIMVVLAALLAA